MKLNRRVPGSRLVGYRGFLALSLVLAAGAVALYLGSGVSISGTTSSGPAGNRMSLNHPRFVQVSSTPQVSAFGKLPLSFEPNQGQSDPSVKFLSRGAGYGLFLTGEEAVLVLQTGPASADSVVRMKLVGANLDSEVVGNDALPGKSNYLIGNDPSKWQRIVPQFARVRYREVYSGIDLVYYGNQGHLEYDFEVAPGADPDNIQLKLAGSKKASLDAAGDLVIETKSGHVNLHAPVVYQMTGSERRPVAGRFVLSAGNHVGFALGPYDRTRTLVIDPTLTYSSYLGGSGDEGCQVILGVATPGCPAIAVDPSFNVYVAGATTSANFPVAGTAPFQATLKGGSDVFVSKFDPTGSTLVFSTYLGGTGNETTAGVAVDAASNVIVAGTTDSTDFPTMNGFQNSPPASSGKNVFLTQLKSDGSALLYSTYLAGTGTDIATGMAIDNKGNAFVTGITTPSGTPDFPTTAGAFQTTPLSATDPEFFLSMIKPSVSGSPSLVFSTYFGGGNPASGAAVVGGGVAADTSGNVYITGGTNFLHVGVAATDFPILNAGQPCLNVPAVATPPNPPPACPNTTALDAFVAKFNPAAGTGAQLVYSTYVGGTGDDIGYGIAVDSGGNVYLTGSTTSTDVFIPTGEVSFQTGNNGNTDAFLAKLTNPATNAIVTLSYFSYVGGTGTDKGFAVAVDPAALATQQARVVGSTTSNDLPHASRSNAGGTDAFMARVDTTASATVNNDSSIYIGGTGTDNGTGVAVDSNTITYVTGDTNSSSGFPIVGSAFQSALSGPSDAFVTKVGLTSDLAITGVTPSVTTIGAGNPATFAYALKNNGPDPTPGVTFTADVPASGSGATFTSISTTSGNCGTAVGGKVLCSLGSLSNGGTATVSVVLTPSTGTTSLTSSGTVSVSPSSNPPSTDPNLANNSSAASIPVTDFSVAPNPSTQTVVAGNPAVYQVQVTPLPTYSNSVSLACSAGLPQGTACTFSTNPVSLPSTSAVSSTMTITTTARPVTTASVRFGSGWWYAMLLPISGLALAGVGGSRQRKKLLGLLLGIVLTGAVFQVACGGGSKAAPTTNPGTPAGTYTVTVTGTSGSASHANTVTLVVQ